MTNIDRQQAFSGTKDAAGVLALDATRLQSYLQANAAGFSGPLSVKQFKGGQSNPTYLLETPARKYVLRRKPPGKLLASAHAVDRVLDQVLLGDRAALGHVPLEDLALVDALAQVRQLELEHGASR